MEENIEQLLVEDILEKKRNGRGIFNRVATRASKKGMRTPFDFLSRKEKQNYTKPSEVHTYMFIPALAELDEMPFEQAKERFIELKHHYKTQELIDAWGLKTQYRFYQINHKYEAYRPRKNKKQMPSSEQTLQALNIAAELELVPESSHQGLTVELSGNYTAEDIANRFSFLSQLFSQEANAQFKVEIHLQEM